MSPLTGSVTPAQHQSSGEVGFAWTAGVRAHRYTVHTNHLHIILELPAVRSTVVLCDGCCVLGELTEPLLISCTCQEDYWNWIFQLQQVRQDKIYLRKLVYKSCVLKNPKYSHTKNRAVK